MPFIRTLEEDPVILLLHGEGANGGGTILDSSRFGWVPASSPLVTTTTAQFKYGSASLDFASGGASINYNRASPFDFGTSPGTLEAFVRATSVDATRRSIFSCQTGGGQPDIAFGLDFVSTGLRFEISTGTTYNSMTAAVAPAASTWNHIAVSWDGEGSYWMYVEGVSIASMSQSGRLNFPNAVISLGSRSTIGGQPFLGQMDEVRFSRKCWYPGGTTFAIPSGPF